MATITQILSQELSCQESYIENVINLLDEGNTIPFIARYRKEAHGSLDDQIIHDMTEGLQYLRNFEQRKNEIITIIETLSKVNSTWKK